MFDDLKSRLGFNRDNDDYGDYDDYDDYDDFDEYGEYDNGYADQKPARDYTVNEPAAVTKSGRYTSSDLSSSLVSINDVKATTPFPDLDEHASQPAQPYAPTTWSSASGGAYADAASSVGTAGYAPASVGGAASAAYAPSASSAPASADVGSYDPYEAYSASNPTAHAPERSLTIVKPAVYGDVERVARAVKSGDVVVLAMRYTPDDLSKRILDFSFGVASALDANVECPGDKVFAIARGSALTPDEKRRLGAQGIL